VFGLKQETASGRLTTLPPPPDEVKGRKKRDNDMPRSLQRMLLLKVSEICLKLSLLRSA
jgi:hypothetical protein